MATLERGDAIGARRAKRPGSPAARLALALALALVYAPARAQAPAPVRAAVTLGPGSVLWLAGTSTLHDYESRTTELALTLERDASTSEPGDAAALDRWLRSGGLRGLELAVPVAALRSGKPALDRNLLRALRAAEHPEIRFRLTHASVAATTGDTATASADGALRVAGQERAIRVEGRLVRSRAGVWLDGRHELRMSEYEVKPPTMMMGTLKRSEERRVGKE